METTEATKRIKAALRQLTDKSWSVTRGQGTASCWIDITAPKARLTNDPRGGKATGPGNRIYLQTADRKDLALAFNLYHGVSYQGIQIAPGDVGRFVGLAEQL